MKAFAELLDRLAYTPSRNDKLRLLADYFAVTPDPDRGWALAALTDGLFFRLPLRRILGELIEPRVDPILFGLSRDYVGDTAETIALLWPGGGGNAEAPKLDDVVQTLRLSAPTEVPRLLAGWLDGLDATGRWALLKLMTGALRVGVSARLAKTALAEWSGKPLAEIEEVWHGVHPPYGTLFAWLSGAAPRPEVGTRPTFRPLMLSHQIEDKELAAIDPKDFVAEWKWDGIRVQAANQGGEPRLFSRTGDDISGSFPDVVEGLPRGVVLDGELLVMRGRRGRAVQRSPAAPQPQGGHAAHAEILPGAYPPLRHAVRGRGGSPAPPLHRAARQARSVAREGEAAAHRRLADARILIGRRARAAVGRRARDRHRRADAEAPLEPLSRRAAQRAIGSNGNGRRSRSMPC